MENIILDGVVEKTFFKPWGEDPYAFKIKSDGKYYFCHLNNFKKNLYETSPKLTEILKEGDEVRFKPLTPGSVLAINVYKDSKRSRGQGGTQER
jgi:hypothetical protein